MFVVLMKCGSCLIDFNSYLKLQLHKAQVHGEKNQMSRYASVKEFQGASSQKEQLAIAEEKLKEEISKFRYYNN